MQTVTTIGLDIAKSVFQVHGVDAAGQVLIRRQLKRRYVPAFLQKLPPCLVGIEACASSHYWSRELQALGHSVRLMPPAYVKPYVKRRKNDMADAEAICEAVTRANMRFVPTKTPEQQSGLMLHRTRHLLIRQQTSVINAIRAHLAEFGITAPVRRGIEELLRIVADPSDKRVPELVRSCLAALGSQLLGLKKQILGDRYLRGLFVAGALAVIRYAKLHGTNHRPWVTALLARRPTKVAAIALANKLARMAWALMARGERYNYPVALRP
jgi:transposase